MINFFLYLEKDISVKTLTSSEQDKTTTEEENLNFEFSNAYLKIDFDELIEKVNVSTNSNQIQQDYCVVRPASSSSSTNDHSSDSNPVNSEKESYSQLN